MVLGFFSIFVPFYNQTIMSSYSLSEEDSLLLRALKRGDTKTFERFFHRYYPMLCAYACRFVSIDDAEEVVQDMFVSFWEKRESMLITSSLNAYLFRIVYYRILNKLAKDDAMRRADGHFCNDMNDLFYAEEPFSMEELRQRIGSALAALPDTYREAFVLYRLRGMECKEVARKLGVSDKLVYYRVQQAVKLLEQDLKEYLPLAILLLSMPWSGYDSL